MQLGEFKNYKGKPSHLDLEVDTEWYNCINFLITNNDGVFLAKMELELPEVEKLVDQLSAWIGHHKA